MAELEDDKYEASAAPGWDAWRHGVRHHAKVEANRLKRGVRDAGTRWGGLVGRQKDRLAARLDHFAEALDDAGERLEQEHAAGEYLGSYAERAARQAERAARYVHDREAKELLEDAEDLARRRPLLFLGGGFLAGLLLARFLRSSGARAALQHPLSPQSPLSARTSAGLRTAQTAQEEEPWLSSTIQ